MAYEVLDKKLMIESCSVGDLTLDQIQSFLRLWGDGSEIRTLSVFLKDDGTVVLNRDNPNYEICKDMTFRYLEGDEEVRKELREKVPEGLKVSLNTISDSIRRRKMHEIFRILHHNCIEPEDISYGVLKKVGEDYGGGGYALFKILNLGIIMGKRAERARRKKTI